MAVSSTLERNEGEDIQIASRRLRIVGIVENSTALANLPNIFLTTEGAQQLVYGGQPLVASIGIRGTLDQVPPGYKAIDRDGAVADLLRPLKVAVNSITIVAILLWVVAALIVGIGDLSVRAGTPAGLRGVQGDRRPDGFDRGRAGPAGDRGGTVCSRRRRRAFGAARTDIPDAGHRPRRYAYIILPVIAVVFGLIASGTGLHRAVSVDPAMAFGGP